MSSHVALKQIVPFSNDEFLQMSQFIYKVAGIRLAAHKKQFLESRLLKRVSELRLQRYGEYLKILQESSDSEVLFLLEAITTHKTEWFRERPHFDFLTRQVLPKFRDGHKPLMVWSAASSTGEEAFSIVCHCLLNGFPLNKVRVLGTDISETVVQFASQGFYPNEGDHQVPSQLQQKNFFTSAIHNGKAGCMVAPEVKAQVKFRTMNLLSLQLPASLSFDVIFLRNVLIYFDEGSTEKVIQQLCQKLNPGGYIIVGLSESLNLSHHGLRSLGQSIYQKE